MSQKMDAIRRKKAALGTMSRFLGNHDMANYNADPNKETVLTPMGIVGLHIASMLGGWRYCNKEGNYRATDEGHTELYDAGTMLRLGLEVQPEYFDTPDGIDFSDPSATYLEINAKTGHYPLHLTQNIFDHRKHEITDVNGNIDDEDRFKLWKDIVERQIFVIYLVPLSGITTKNRLASIFHPEAAVNWGIDPNDTSQTIVPNVVRADIANISKHTRGIIKGDIDGISAGLLTEKVWRFIFDKTDFANAGERAQQVLEAKNATEVKMLVDHVEAGDGVSAAFNAVVGNPPYQEGESMDAIYHRFMQVSQLLGKYVSLIYLARWLGGGGRGAGLEEFREKELNSENYVKFVLDPRSDFFENVETKGGVNYFLWKKGRKGLTEYVHGNDSPENRKTLVNGKSTFIRETRFSKISDKVNVGTYLSPSPSHYYGVQVKSDYKIEALNSVVNEGSETVEIYFSSKGGGVRSLRIEASEITKNTNDYKVFVSKTADPSKGSLRRLNRVFVGHPGEICSSSFIVFPGLKDQETAENLVRYIKTDFASFLLGINSHTQDAYAKVYRLIPDIDPATGEIKDKPGVFLDFSGNSDDIDNQLARIYGLTDEERELMRTSIKPWKDKNSLTADGLY